MIVLMVICKGRIGEASHPGPVSDHDNGFPQYLLGNHCAPSALGSGSVAQPDCHAGKDGRTGGLGDDYWDVMSINLNAINGKVKYITAQKRTVMLV